MSKITDAEANATSLDGLVNDNGLITTLRNGPKPSYQYLVDGWNTEFDALIDDFESQGDDAIASINADVVTVEAAKNTAINNINADVTFVDSAKNSALDYIDDAIVEVTTKIDSFNSVADTAISDFEDESEASIAAFEANSQAAIIEMQKSRGLRVVGTFADGFTYELFNDVGIDADGNSWIYVGAGAPNKVVPAGTVPSVGAGYEQVVFNVASNIQSNIGNVQGFIDSFELKVFQSPTPSNATLIESYTKQPNQVFEVRKTSDDTLATIYSDEDGSSEIAQNGVDNKSSTSGEIVFYIDDGDYYISISGASKNFKADNSSDIAYVKDFGGDVQVAINSGASIVKGDLSEWYETSNTILTQNGQSIRDVKIRAKSKMGEIIRLASFSSVYRCELDCNNTATANNINWVGADWAIRSLGESGTSCINNTITNPYSGGVQHSIHTDLQKSNSHIVNNNRIYGCPDLLDTSVRAVIGVHLHNIANPKATETTISEMDPTYSYRCKGSIISGNIIENVRYGVGISSSSFTKVSGNDISFCTRGVSVQHGVIHSVIEGNTIRHCQSTGIQVSSGVRKTLVTNNTVTGTMQLDNSAIQCYYGCEDVIISNNILDSNFSSWDGGKDGSSRNPGSGIRVGQHVKNISIIGNTVIGFRWGINLKSTVYEDTILASDPNYFSTGFQNIKIGLNDMRGDYFSDSTSGFKLPHRKNLSYACNVVKSATWEDVTKGGLNLEGVTVTGNTASNTAFNYVFEYKSGGTSSPTMSQWIIANNVSILSSFNDALFINTPFTSNGIIESNNSWLPVNQPSFNRVSLTSAESSVKGAKVAFVVGTPTITKLTEGYVGQVVSVRMSSGATISYSNEYIRTIGGADLTGDSNKVFQFLCVGTDTWVQI